MTRFTHRQRVIAAFNHTEADRIPLDLMGNASMLLDPTYLRLRDYLQLEPIPPIRSGTTANYYDERILDRLDIDFRRIFLKKSPHNKVTRHKDGSFSDIWGIRYQQTGALVNVIHYPLAGISTLKDIDSYEWPAADEMFHTEGLAEQARQMYEQTDFALVARNPLSGGFLEHSCNLLGMERFLMLMAAEPTMGEAIIAHLLTIYCDVYAMFLDTVGLYVQMVEVSDDLGSQENLIISPQMYRQFIKPAEKELYTLIHKKAPQAALFHHTDGAVFDIIPDLIEVGVDVLNPVQTSSKGMDGQRLKKQFGDVLTFHGAVEEIDKRVSTEQVIAEVKQRIDTLAAGGGYVLGPCNHMVDVPAEMIIAMYETADEYGRY
jgi:uroporphyrinogen decarboxylase